MRLLVLFDFVILPLVRLNSGIRPIACSRVAVRLLPSYSIVILPFVCLNPDVRLIVSACEYASAYLVQWPAVFVLVLRDTTPLCKCARRLHVGS